MTILSPTTTYEKRILHLKKCITIHGGGHFQYSKGISSARSIANVRVLRSILVFPSAVHYISALFSNKL